MTQRTVTVLSIDGGGGIRGIIPGMILAHLETKLQVKIFKTLFSLQPHLTKWLSPVYVFIN